ncbi:MAG: UvrD-helicase domain-containing protein, partial [Magnetospirillum sp.]|nr:UvrD-helicase domain-containing protein [Magnetospirillum sp.]
LCVRILRRHPEAVGLKSNFTILDSDDQLRLLKQVMESAHVDNKQWPAQGLMAAIQRWKDKGLTPDKVGSEGGEQAGGQLATLYRLYQERLLAVNACDFGDLLLHCLTLFLGQPAVLADYQEQFRYLLVDEYQDTNVAQYLWLRLLAQKHRNICCVGDDDQSIYSWRGAEVGNILKFEHDFPGAKVVRLESNYRSTPHILAAASALIAHNEGRLGKTLRPGLVHAPGTAEKVRVTGVWDGETEARRVVEEIETLQRAGEPLATMAILVRAGFQTREFEERLITTGVPYRVIGGPRFYERQEIRDAMAYFRLVVSADDSLAFERIVNLPKRGLGDAALQTIHVTSRLTRTSLFEAARKLIDTDELKPKPRAALARFVADLDRWRTLLGGLDHAELAEMILDESGYLGMWKADKSPEAPGRVENLKELARALEDYESLQGFLEHVALVMDNEQNPDADKVTIMTLHGAKGLEFDSVFLPGWEEGVFPHQRAMDEGGAKGLEEERRLAYVGLTRARRRVMVTFAANRRIYNQWQTSLPSRFLDELPEAHVAREAEGGLYAGGGHTAATGYRRPPPTIEATSWKVAERRSGSGFSSGDRVHHTKFGPGTVLAVDGDKLEIAFDKAGHKKVLDSYVEAV